MEPARGEPDDRPVLITPDGACRAAMEPARDEPDDETYCTWGLGESIAALNVPDSR